MCTNLLTNDLFAQHSTRVGATQNAGARPLALLHRSFVPEQERSYPPEACRNGTRLMLVLRRAGYT